MKNDTIGSFISKGEPAGLFAPHVEVWSETAVRACVMRALNSVRANTGLQSDGRYAPPPCPRCGETTAHKHVDNLNSAAAKA